MYMYVLYIRGSLFCSLQVFIGLTVVVVFAKSYTLGLLIEISAFQLGISPVLGEAPPGCRL